MNFANLIALSLSFLSLGSAAAQTCAPASKEMAQYQAQRNWRAHSIPGEGDVAPVLGYVDPDGNFYFGDLSRGGALASILSVDPKNRGFKSFFKYCAAGKLDYLRSMRRNREGNRYRLSLRYLPELTGFANDPFKAQKMKDVENTLRVQFGADSSIDTYEWSAQSIKKDLVAELNRQIAEQPLGQVDLDLTGWDDVVCDLVQGKVQLSISRSALSEGPNVELKKEVEPQEISLAYRKMREAAASANGKEQTIFAAARALGKLEADRQVGTWAESRGFTVMQKMMNAEMSRLKDLDESALICVADQLQTYKRPHLQHFIGVKFKLPSLEEIEAAAQEKRQ